MADSAATATLSSHRPAPSTSRFTRTPFGPATTSPPGTGFRSDMFSSTTTTSATTTGGSHNPIYSTSPTNERYPAVGRSGMPLPGLNNSLSDPAGFTRSSPAVVIRRLPANIGVEALRSMLIFASDLIDTELVRALYPEDHGYATAVAHFETSSGALEAQQKLHGKPNTTKEATMIVEAYSGSGAGVGMGAFERRNTIDSGAPRAQSSSASSGGSGGAPTGRSRFNSTFATSERISPPLPSATGSGGSGGEFPIPENSAHFQNLFSPQSPLTNGIEGAGHRISGKSVINDDAVDDETGELLKDPVAYAKSGQQQPPFSRRQTNPQIPISSFGRLSLSNGNGLSSGLSSGLTSPISSGILSPRGPPPSNSTGLTSPVSSSHLSHMGSSTPTGPSGAYVSGFPRAQYPPVNPADQNPPCNTLYVGNLPIDTSEDELKSIFSKQRGYKRLCFRTKQNGPMCFVEFEDVAYATKALNDLYGQPLHNSVKGGIRLSFSKNPLGVRSGQPTSLVNAGGVGSNGMILGPHSIMSPQALSPGYGGPGMIGPGGPMGGIGGSANGLVMPGSTFSGVSGPPPGLATPPGLQLGGYHRSPPISPPVTAGGQLDPVLFGNPFAMAAPGAPRSYSGGIPPSMGNGTYGRENVAAGGAAFGVNGGPHDTTASNGYGDQGFGGQGR